jgi:hypothetical protein
VGRVVSATNAEPVDWFRIESRLEDISTFSHSSHPQVGPSAALTKNSAESASGDSVVSLSSHEAIVPEFLAAIAGSDSLNRLATR